VGSVDTSEFAVAVSATLGFLISMGWSQINWTWVAALMVGGIFAAPIAAWLIRIIPSHLLGVLVGGLIIITNAKTLLNSLDWVPSTWHAVIYGALSLLWAASVLLVVLRRVGQKKVSLSE
jgi:hypothetical protein